VGDEAQNCPAVSVSGKLMGEGVFCLLVMKRVISVCLASSSYRSWNHHAANRCKCRRSISHGWWSAPLTDNQT